MVITGVSEGENGVFPVFQKGKWIIKSMGWLFSIGNAYCKERKFSTETVVSLMDGSKIIVCIFRWSLLG